MKINYLPLTLLTIASAAFAAEGIGLPEPSPQVNRAPVDIKAVVSGYDTNYNPGANVAVLVTVFDSATGKPVLNLTKGNFKLTLAVVNGYAACVTPPVISFFESNSPGIYRMLVNFGPNSCWVWTKGQQPVAIEMTSTFNQFVINSPGNYQGRTVATIEVR